MKLRVLNARWCCLIVYVRRLHYIFSVVYFCAPLCMCSLGRFWHELVTFITGKNWKAWMHTWKIDGKLMLLSSPSPPFDNIWSYSACLEVKREYYYKCFIYIANVLPLQWAQLTKTVHTARLGLEFVFLWFLGCVICLYVGVCFVLPWTVESFPFMFWRWRNKLKWAPFEFFWSLPIIAG